MRQLMRTSNLSFALGLCLLSTCVLGCDSSESDAAGEGGSGGGTTATGTGGSPPAEQSTCDRYLACTSEVQPENLPAADVTYGPDGLCWKNFEAGVCNQACSDALVGLHLIHPDVPSCAVCTSDAECGGTTPYCSAERGECVPCTTAAHCQAPTPACHPMTNTCVACASDTDCQGDLPACDPGSSTCVECTSGSDCDSGTCENDNTCCVAESPCWSGSCGTLTDNCGNSVACGGCDNGDYCDSETSSCEPITTTFDCNLNGTNNTCTKNLQYCQYYFAGPGSTAWCSAMPAECQAQPTCACLLAAGEYFPPDDECQAGTGPNGVGTVFITSTQ